MIVSYIPYLDDPGANDMNIPRTHFYLKHKKCLRNCQNLLIIVFVLFWEFLHLICEIKH